MGNKKDNKKRLDVEMHQGVNVKTFLLFDKPM